MKRAVLITIVCMSSIFISDKVMAADYRLDYNTSVMSTFEIDEILANASPLNP